jgi:hypothetical protein
MRFFQSELADGHPWTGSEIQVLLALNLPARVGELPVDLNTGLRLTGEVVVLG